MTTLRFGVRRLDIKRVIVEGSHDIQFGLTSFVAAAGNAGADKALFDATIKELALLLIDYAWDLSGRDPPSIFEVVEDIRGALPNRVPLHGPERG